MSYQSKFKQRFFKHPDINCEDNFMVGFVWPVTGSKGNSYDVEMHSKGFTCECIGFHHHGKCKHIKEVTARLVCEEIPEYAI